MRSRWRLRWLLHFSARLNWQAAPTATREREANNGGDVARLFV